MSASAPPHPNIPQILHSEHAIRAMVSGFRASLKGGNMYSGSKLELMDRFGVKLSSLASRPVFFDVGKTSIAPPPKATQKKEPNVNSSKKRSAPSGSKSEQSGGKSSPSKITGTRKSSRNLRPPNRGADEGYCE
jgi:hypothetical protein